MPANVHVSPVDQFAQRFGSAIARIEALERRRGGAGGGGGGQSAYQWSNSTTMADPGSGKLRANTANPTLATTLAVSLYDKNGMIVPGIAQGVAGDEFVVYEGDDATKWVKYRLTAKPTITGSWASAAVTVVATGTGGFAPANNSDVNVAARSGGSGGLAQFWNSSWGVVGLVKLPASTLTGTVKLTIATLSGVPLMNGRRYRVAAWFRAWASTPSSANANVTITVEGPFISAAQNAHDQYATLPAGFGQAEWEDVLDCTVDTPSATYVLSVTPNVVSTFYGGENSGLMVEDIGPTARIASDATPPTDWTAYDSRYVLKAGDTMSPGDLTISAPGELNFGTSTRQMLNLYSSSYGIGVQGSTEYFRSGSGTTGFAWYGGGVHSVTQWDPGAGGVEVMRLVAGTSQLALPGRNKATPTQAEIVVGSNSATVGPRHRIHCPASGDIMYYDFDGATALAGSLQFRCNTTGCLLLSDTDVRCQKPTYITGQTRIQGGVQGLILTDGGNGPYIGFYPGTSVDSIGTRKGYMGFATATAMYVNNESTGALLLMSGSSGAVTFSVGTTEQARMDASGNFLVNKTASAKATTGCELLQTGSAQFTRADTGSPLIVNKQVGATSNTPFASWQVDGVQIGSITRNAATQAVLYNLTSHGPWKGNVEDLDDDEAIERVLLWRPVSFQWKYDAEHRTTEDGEPGGEVQHGFIAQELNEVQPSAVSEGHGTEAEQRAWEAEWEAHRQAIADHEALAADRDRILTEYGAAVEAVAVERDRLTREYDLAVAAAEAEASEASAESTTESGLVVVETLPAPVLPDMPPDPVLPVLPEYPTPPTDIDPFTPWSVDPSSLVPDLTAAVQALVRQVRAQAEEIAELRALVTSS